MPMRRVGIVLGLVASIALSSPTLASTRPTVHDTVRDGNRLIRLSMDISTSGTSHMSVHIKDPDGVYPYCSTVQFERKSTSGWRKVGSGSAYDRDCFKTPAEAEGQSETESFWDNFAYPSGKLKSDFLAGKDVRVHGFTSLGGDVKFAFRRLEGGDRGGRAHKDPG